LEKVIIIILIFLESITASVNKKPGTSRGNAAPVNIDLDSIRSRGRLIAVTDYNSTSYFIYRGEPMGFHYELLTAFADHIGVDLEMVTENNLENAFDLLNKGKADMMAIGLTVNATRKNEILFSDPIYETRQVFVQRKPQQWQSMTKENLNKKLIRNQLDLANKTVFVQERSSHSERLHSLSREIGDSINIIEVPHDAEQLIQSVATGEIEYTVCDENVAVVNSTYYPDIDIKTPVSFPQNIAWGLRKENSDMLARELNHWLAAYKRTGAYALLYAKYFKNARSSRIVKSDYYAPTTGKISRWDNMIKSASSDINWDWRLLASLIYQESRFKPDVRSWAGAYGLMQVMPGTGKKLGIDITSSPSNNIKAGTLYIEKLQSVFDPKIEDENERMKFILASYNAGPGHVLDAMRLAEKYGMDPQKWDGNVELWLTKKSEPLYYNDTVVKNGYFRGTESINFVAEILDRFEHYKNFIPEHISQNYN
jgi:membrane-bound lytic murein transglycosylase F